MNKYHWILLALEESERPLFGDEIHQAIVEAGGKISLGEVYLALARLVKAGFVEATGELETNNQGVSHRRYRITKLESARRRRRIDKILLAWEARRQSLQTGV